MSFNVHILRDEADYQAALAAYERYFDDEPAAGSEAADHFMLLGLLLARYEEEHHPLPDSDPIEALLFAMDRLGLAQPDLAKLLGSRSRASEILNRRRELTLPQIRTLCREWRIPASALINSYPLARAVG